MSESELNGLGYDLSKTGLRSESRAPKNLSQVRLFPRLFPSPWLPFHLKGVIKKEGWEWTKCDADKVLKVK